MSNAAPEPQADVSARRGRWWLAAVAAAVALLPFVGRPLNFDDPLFVWAARQIAVHPLDPYGFTVNWAGFGQPFYRAMQNPPLAAYWLAVVGTAAGWGEVALHLGQLPFALAAAVGVYLLAAEFCRRPLLAVALMLACPAFLLPATSVMCDVPLLCWWTWAVVLWVWASAATDAGRAVALTAGASFAATAAVLTKYPGVDLVPLLAAHAVLCPAARRSTRLTQAIALLLPVVALIAWDRATAAGYGVGLFRDASAYARAVRAHAPLSLAARSLNTLAFAGGGGLPLAAVAVAMLVTPGRTGAARLTRALIGLAAVLAIGVTAAGLCPAPAGWAGRSGPPTWLWFAEYAGLATAGTALLSVCVAGVRRAGTDAVDRRRGLFLLLWVGGVFAFAAVVNWSANARSLLPMLPAVAILIVRAGGDRLHWPVGAAAALGAMVSVAVTVDDARVALVNRDVAVRTAAMLSPRPGQPGPRVWFGGHWGFQYYMQQRGGRPLDANGPTPAPGDAIVLPLDNDGPFPLPPHLHTEARIEVGPGYWMSTMSNPMGGGFYASNGDRLPFILGPVPPESFLVARVDP